MIIGRVSERREATIPLLLRAPDGSFREVEATIDTGFNHELTLPPDWVRELRLQFAASVQATLAGDVRVYVDYYRAVVKWDGESREVSVLEMEGVPLVGMELLAFHRLTIDVTPAGVVRIERISENE